MLGLPINCTRENIDRMLDPFAPPVEPALPPAEKDDKCPPRVARRRPAPPAARFTFPGTPVPSMTDGIFGLPAETLPQAEAAGAAGTTSVEALKTYLEDREVSSLLQGKTASEIFAAVRELRRSLRRSDAELRNATRQRDELMARHERSFEIMRRKQKMAEAEQALANRVARPADSYTSVPVVSALAQIVTPRGTPAI